MKSITQGFLMATILLIVGFCGWGAIAVVAQQPDDEDQTRQVFAEEFLKARPAGQRRTSRPTGTSPSKPAQNNPTQAAGMLGITLWRLRPAAASDDTQARLLEQEADSEVVLVGERVGSDTIFKEGQKVRLGVESPRTGYLYVIDREQYADGTFNQLLELGFGSSIRREWAWRVKRGESLANLQAFADFAQRPVD